MIWAVGFIPSAWLWDQDRCDRVGFLQGVSRAAWRTIGQQRAITIRSTVIWGEESNVRTRSVVVAVGVVVVVVVAVAVALVDLGVTAAARGR